MMCECSSVSTVDICCSSYSLIEHSVLMVRPQSVGISCCSSSVSCCSSSSLELLVQVWRRHFKPSATASVAAELLLNTVGGGEEAIVCLIVEREGERRGRNVSSSASLGLARIVSISVSSL